MRRFIVSNDPRSEKLTWHYAVRRISRGITDPSRIFARYFVAACGNRLGSAWGNSVREFDGVPTHGEVCQRCARLKTVPADEQE